MKKLDKGKIIPKVAKGERRYSGRAVSYEEAKRRLSVIHKFNFNTRKRFSPQQKSAITRAWLKYQHDIIALEDGRAIFKKEKRSKVKKYPKVHHTNKGLIFREKAKNGLFLVTLDNFNDYSELDEDAILDTYGERSLRDINITAICREKRLDILIPIPYFITPADFAELCFNIFNPTNIVLSVYGNRAKTPYRRGDIHKYLSDLSKDLGKDNFITSLYMVYPNTKNNRKKWTIRC